MKCPVCNTENRDDRAECYQCQADLTILRIILLRAKQHYNNGLEHAERGRTSQAIEELKKAIELYSQHLPSHNVLGTLYAKKGMLKEAIAEWETALAIDPSTKKAHEYIQKALESSQVPPLQQKLNRVYKLVAGLFFLFCVTTIIVVYSFYLNRLYLSGMTELQSGNYRAAYAKLSKLVKNPVSAAIADGARLAMAQGDTQVQTALDNIDQKWQKKQYEEALELSNRLLRMSLPELWVQKVQAKKNMMLTAIIQQDIAKAKEIYETKGDYVAAIQTMLQVQSRYPESASIPEYVNAVNQIQTDWFNKRFALIDQYRRAKKYELALQVCQQLQQAESDKQFFMPLPVQKKIKETITAVKKEKTQDDYQQIQINIRAKKYGIAYSLLTAISVDNLDSSQQVWLKDQLPSIRSSLAQQYWKEITSISRNIITQNLDRETAQQVILKSRFIVSAVPQADFADDALYYQGLALEQVKDWKEAIACYTQLANQYPKSQVAADAMYRIGSCYEQLKDYDKAIVSYRKVMERFPKGGYTGNPTARIKAIEKLTTQPKPTTSTKPSPKK